MGAFFTQFGIDWKLLLSQAVNFLLLFVVLRSFAYKPILSILQERRQRIEEGLNKADEADKRLEEVQHVVKQERQQAEAEALQILKAAETRAKTEEVTMLEEARKRQQEVLANAELLARGEREKAREAVYKESVELVRGIIAKTVELSPEAIDNALVEQAVKKVSHG